MVLALPLPPALCLVSPLGHFPVQTPGWSQKHTEFTEQQGNVGQGPVLRGQMGDFAWTERACENGS